MECFGELIEHNSAESTEACDLSRISDKPEYDGKRDMWY